MAEAIKEGNQVTEDYHEQSSLMEPEPEPEWTPGDAGKKIFNNVLQNKRNISTLTLKVISGPSSGLCMSITSAFSPAILTIGRAPPASFILNDSEVSGKQAVVKFNKETQKWEITDLGSLNGTYMNSKAIHHPDVGSRNHGSANVLSSGDVITFGTASNVSVNIKKNDLANSPSGRGGGKALNLIFNLPSPGIGMASDLQRNVADLGATVGTQEKIEGDELKGRVVRELGQAELKKEETASGPKSSNEIPGPPREVCDTSDAIKAELADVSC